MYKATKNISTDKIVFLNSVHKDIIEKSLEKEYAFVAILKSLHVGGTLKNYKKRTNHFANQIGCSTKTLSRRVKKLEELKWIYFDHGHLFIKSWENITNLLIGSYSLNKEGKKRIVRKSIEINATQQGVDAIRIECIKSNFLSQRSKIPELLADSGTDQKGDKTILKNLGVTTLKMEQIRRNKDLQRKGRTVKVTNLDITLSREGIAKQLGFKSKSSAQNLIKRAISYGWIKEEVRYGIIEYVPGEVFAKMANSYKKSTGVFYKNGILFKKLSSKLTFLNDENFSDLVGCAKSKESHSERTRKKVDRVYNNLLARQELLLSLGGRFRCIEDFFKHICAGGNKTWGRDISIAIRKENERFFGKSDLDTKELYPKFNSMSDKNNYIINKRSNALC